MKNTKCYGCNKNTNFLIDYDCNYLIIEPGIIKTKTVTVCKFDIACKYLVNEKYIKGKSLKERRNVILCRGCGKKTGLSQMQILEIKLKKNEKISIFYCCNQWKNQFKIDRIFYKF